MATVNGILSSVSPTGIWGRSPEVSEQTDLPAASRADQALWQGIANGDADAFGSLYERYANAIYNYCLRRVGNRALAEDLTSIVFLEVLRKRRAAIDARLGKAWLYGVATNVLRNTKRSQRRHASALARLSLEERVHDFADDTLARLDSERALSHVVLGLNKLPKHERETFALCVLADLSYEETAAALGVPVGTIRSRMSRARSRLRQFNREAGYRFDELESEGDNDAQ